MVSWNLLQQTQYGFSARMVYFKNLRVEISCPEGGVSILLEISLSPVWICQGVFTIDGFGDGARNAGALSTASLEVSPDTEVSGQW